MGVGHLSELEAVGVQDGCHLTGFGKLCGFAQDFAVVRPALPGQHRQQCEDPRICGGAERQRCQRMRSPAQATDHMPKPLHRVGGIQHWAAYGIHRRCRRVDVEAAATGVGRNVILHRDHGMVDGDGVKLLDPVLLSGGTGRENFRPKRAGNLNDDMPDTSSPPTIRSTTSSSCPATACLHPTTAWILNEAEQNHQVKVLPSIFRGRFASARVAGALVTFEPGARTAWHTHPLGQTLIVTWAAASSSVKAVRSKKSVRAMSFGFRRARSTTEVPLLAAVRSAVCPRSETGSSCCPSSGQDSPLN
jgi:hypothetical protein